VDQGFLSSRTLAQWQVMRHVKFGFGLRPSGPD
jgi:hypothetical protein